MRLRMQTVMLTLMVAFLTSNGALAGVPTVNGWYEGEEIYYLDLGVEKGVLERGENDIYVIGGPRLYQANIVEFIPGESGYSPHWNVHVVHTAENVTVQDVVDVGLAVPGLEKDGQQVLFDNVMDILIAEAMDLVTIDTPGVVVLCPVISKKGADAPGQNPAPEVFPPFPDTF